MSDKKYGGYDMPMGKVEPGESLYAVTFDGHDSAARHDSMRLVQDSKVEWTRDLGNACGYSDVRFLLVGDAPWAAADAQAAGEADAALWSQGVACEEPPETMMIPTPFWSARLKARKQAVREHLAAARSAS